MKKALLITAFSFLFFNVAFAEDDPEVIGVDHDQPIIQELIKGVQDFSNQIFSKVDNVTEIITDEVERRQEIVEDQIEERKKNLFSTIKDEFKKIVNSLIESTFDSIEDSINSDSSQTGDVD